MNSAAYMQSSADEEVKRQVDRDDLLLWRRLRTRLEAEIIRDALLAVSGTPAA